ncbi:MAG: DUF3299 domain-containing protein [Planctomycetota bacterium]
METATTARAERARSASALSACLLTAALVACGTGDPSTREIGDGTAASASVDVVVERGTPFSAPDPAVEAALASGDDLSVRPAPRAAVLQELQANVDPDRLTPEALAKNPLVIGVEKRAPFVLAEGADPLDPNSYDWEKDEDGHWIVSYADLSLDGVDSEELLDALVYPEEYEGENLVFPNRIMALDGEKVALTGYMIAMAWSDSRVTNYMLVRDLLACCYGGSPEPDEWVDVHMEGRGAHNFQYVPVRTRGVFHVQGVADDAGYATGAFRIDGTDARED